MGSTMASTAILSYDPDVHLIDLISQLGQRSAVRALTLVVDVRFYDRVRDL